MVSKETKANAGSDHVVPFDARLSATLKSRGMSQKDLAAASGLTQAAIGHYVKGARIPSLGTDRDPHFDRSLQADRGPLGVGPCRPSSGTSPARCAQRAII